ncbi:MAG: Fe(3+) ABC transporter substrate-binding protein [Gammaproteobacteria bacterium]|nr:Fe(3+) ABC transporter substrate-binding protein [Gammaproteobacteria bacterium]
MAFKSTFFAPLSVILTVAALFAEGVQAAGEVNLYSARKEALIKPLLDRFTEQTGITVNLVTGGADALLKRLQSEGRNSPADLLITTDAGRLYRAREAGVTQPVVTEALRQAVPEAYREPDGHWYGLSLRARPIFYAKARVSAEELSSYEGLADPKWAGRICIRSSGNIYNQSLVASMIAHQGEAKSEQWALGLVKNFARSPKGGDRDQIKAAAAGECDIAVANTYYYGGMISGKDEAERQAAEKVAVFWPNQSGRGTHVNVSGAALTAHARNRDNAVKLMEFLVQPESQSWYAEVNYEYPVREGVAWSALLQQWGRFKSDNLNLSELGKYNSQAVMIMDRAGWK